MAEPQRQPLPPPLPTPLVADLAAEEDGTLHVGDTFDVHTWFEAYLAEEHEEALELQGVPFH